MEIAPFNKARTNATIRLRSLNGRCKIINKGRFTSPITHLHRLRQRKARLNLYNKRDLINTYARDIIFLKATR
jgi:hypothetical protein